ncbi:MAG TPA: metalloregulator ArsR/SmtB family transcription factor [Patescibacteria group bacterium]|nr:metalloregulator ArsR/SmtB family transcription factor [Patescibacteria group bacterium]
MDLFQALAESKRRHIVTLIAQEGQLTAGAITRKFKISQPAVSQHLQVLRASGILHMEKWGRERVYQVEPKALAEIEDWIHDLKKLWHGRLDRLGALLEVESRKTRRHNRGPVRT